MKIFLSHSSRNKPLLREIKTHFPSWLEPWLDEEKLLFGEELGPALSSAINIHSDFLLIFICEEAVRSEWVRQELAWAIQREAECKSVLVLPVLLEGGWEHLADLGLKGRLTIRLPSYQETDVENTAGKIIEHISGWMARKIRELRDQVEQLESGIRTVGHVSSGPLSRHFPYSIGRLEKQLEFQIDGSGSQTQRWIGLKANQTFLNLEIPWSFSLDHKDASIGDTKCLDAESGPLILFTNPRYDNPSGSQKRVHGKFRIVGYFSAGDPPVTFGCRQGFHKGFLCTREEVAAEYANTDWPEEYTSSSPFVAIGEISISVLYPEEFVFATNKPKAVAFIGETHVLHYAETARVEGMLRCQGNRAILDVPDPILGLRYAISWIPPLSNRNANAKPTA